MMLHPIMPIPLSVMLRQAKIVHLNTPLNIKQREAALFGQPLFYRESFAYQVNE